MTAHRDTRSESRTAILLGATGLVGRECLSLLRASSLYSEIRIVTRRIVDHLESDGRVRQVLVDFEHLEDRCEDLIGDDVFCAFGTTIKKAGTQDRFRQVDLVYPAEFARIVRRNGGQHFSLVSSRGANPASRIFYLRTKGELEVKIRGQEWPSVTILRPSVIGGHRHEARPAERIGQVLLRAAPRSLRTVPAGDIAAGMVSLARERHPGVRVFESGEILRH